MRNCMLGCVLAALFLFQQPGIAQEQLQSNKTLQFVSHEIKQNDVHVNLVEAANVVSAQGIQTTSLLFMVEHLGNNKIKPGASTIEFLDANAKPIPQKGSSNEELVKSGTTIQNYSKYKSPWQAKLPKPENRERAYIVQQWFRTHIPENSKFLSLTLSGEKFKFTLTGG